MLTRNKAGKDFVGHSIEIDKTRSLKR